MKPGKPWVTVLVAVVAGGCSSTRVTDPARCATEQLLMSAAADRAAEQIDLAALGRKKVFVDPAYYDGYDKGYVVGALAERIVRQDGRLVQERKDAEVVAAIRSGALSVDRSETLIGIPSFGLPVPFAGEARTPELAIFKRVRQSGVAKLAVWAHAVPSGEKVVAVGPVYGKSYLTRWIVLGLPFLSTDVAAKRPRHWWLPWNE